MMTPLTYTWTHAGQVLTGRKAIVDGATYYRPGILESEWLIVTDEGELHFVAWDRLTVKEEGK